MCDCEHSSYRFVTAKGLATKFKMAARIASTSIRRCVQQSTKFGIHPSFSTSQACCVRRAPKAIPEKQYDPEEGSRHSFDNDFFGITSDEGIVTVDNVLTDKHQRLKKFANLTRSRYAKVSDEKVRDATFGIIRYDSDNSPKYHGQYEDDILLDEAGFAVTENMPAERVTRDMTTASSKAVRVQIPSEGVQTTESVASTEADITPRKKKATKAKKRQKNALENGSLGTQEQSQVAIDMTSHAMRNKNSVEPVSDCALDSHDYVHEVGGSTTLSSDSSAAEDIIGVPDKQVETSKQTREKLQKSASEEALEQKVERSTHPRKQIKEKHLKFQPQVIGTKLGTDDNVVEGSDNSTFDVSTPVKLTKGSIQEEYKPTLQLSTAIKEESEDEEPPKTAFEYLKRKSAQSSDTKLDSKGFYILRSEIRPQIHHLLRSEMVALLHKRVLYNDHDIVVLDKPYGMVIHGKVEGLPDSCVLTSVLPDLAEALAPRDSKINKLYTVHRLDRDVTGTLLLAKTQRMADTLQSLLEQRQVTKTYWAITRGVPSNNEGIIDIPIAEGSVGTARRMVLCPRLEPEFEHLVPKFKKTFQAVTKYRVLDSNINAAYLELNPESGFHHQLRVHLGLALRCPILGDHKYSHLRRLAPQKLPGDMLQKLGVRQAKVRDVPLHLHARRLVVPEVLEGRNLVVVANPPYHFAKNLKRLKLRKD